MTDGRTPARRLRAAQARLLLETTAVPQEVIAELAGISPSGLAARATREGWKRRYARAVPPPAVQAPAEAPGGGIDRTRTGREMEAFIAGRIAQFGAEASAGGDVDRERTARTVAHYARALTVIRDYLAALEKDRQTDAALPPPRSLRALRDELRIHLERLWDEARPAPCAGDAEPDG